MATETKTDNYLALIIDDNWYNRDIFRIALEDANYTVTQAEDGQQGLERLDEQRYDLLVLDLQMPGINGEEVLRVIRSKPQFDHMRVLVVTANAHMAAGEVSDAADHVMFKPVDVLEFTKFTNRLKKTFNDSERN